jgi:hypothetical protein
VSHDIKSRRPAPCVVDTDDIGGGGEDEEECREGAEGCDGSERLRGGGKGRAREGGGCCSSRIAAVRAGGSDLEGR